MHNCFKTNEIYTDIIHTYATLRLSIYTTVHYTSYKMQSEHTDKCIIYTRLIVCYDDGTHFCANRHAQFVSYYENAFESKDMYVSQQG